MTLKEIIDNYNNIEELAVNENIPKDLLKSAKSTLENEIIEKVINIIEYRKELLNEGKSQKIIELDEYIQYCLYLARIYELEIGEIKIKVSKERIDIYGS